MNLRAKKTKVTVVESDSLHTMWELTMWNNHGEYERTVAYIDGRLGRRKVLEAGVILAGMEVQFDGDV